MKKIDLKDFVSINKPDYVPKSPYITFSNNPLAKGTRKLHVGSPAVKYFRHKNVDRIKGMISKDNKTFIILPCENEGVSTHHNSVGFANTYMIDFLTAMAKGDNLKFYGEIDDENSMIIFDMTKPYFY